MLTILFIVEKVSPHHIGLLGKVFAILTEHARSDHSLAEGQNNTVQRESPKQGSTSANNRNLKFSVGHSFFLT